MLLVLMGGLTNSLSRVRRGPSLDCDIVVVVCGRKSCAVKVMRVSLSGVKAEFGRGQRGLCCGRFRSVKGLHSRSSRVLWSCVLL